MTSATVRWIEAYETFRITRLEKMDSMQAAAVSRPGDEMSHADGAAHLACVVLPWTLVRLIYTADFKRARYSEVGKARPFS